MATMTENITAPPTGRDQPSSNTDAAASPYDFAFKDFLRKEYQFGLSISQPYCKAFREGHCPLGKGRCPDKHPITLSHSTLICKHWLRGLCKKGESCDFSHEYNLRKMQECINFTRTLFCPNGDECVYLHIDPASKLPPCPHYDKGFCPLGPNCSKKHVRKTLCPFYLAGFCPYGPKCEKGAHPRWKEDLPKPTVKVEKTAEEVERERNRIQEEGEREDERERERRDGNRRDGRGRGGKGRKNPREAHFATEQHCYKEYALSSGIVAFKAFGYQPATGVSLPAQVFRFQTSKRQVDYQRFKVAGPTCPATRLLELISRKHDETEPTINENVRGREQIYKNKLVNSFDIDHFIFGLRRFSKIRYLFNAQLNVALRLTSENHYEN